MRPTSRFVVAFVLGTLVLASTILAPTALAQPPGPLGGTVGIRVSVSNIDPAMRSADLDLTMYTRGYGPTTTTGVGYAGFPFLGYPALDYGDGNTVSYAYLGLTNSGGGPGGSNVYRSMASFSHTYPAAGGSFTARTAMFCVACFRVTYAFFPPGSPTPTAFTQTVDLRPSNVIGNFPVTYSQPTTVLYSPFLSTSIVYRSAYYPLITNATRVPFSVPEIPTASEWGFISLGALLLLTGLFALRRTAG